MGAGDGEFAGEHLSVLTQTKELVAAVADNGGNALGQVALHAVQMAAAILYRNDEVDHRLVHDLFAGIAKDILRGTVIFDDQTLCVDHNDRIERAGYHRSKACGGRADLFGIALGHTVKLEQDDGHDDERDHQRDGQRRDPHEGQRHFFAALVGLQRKVLKTAERDGPDGRLHQCQLGPKRDKVCHQLAIGRVDQGDQRIKTAGNLRQQIVEVRLVA